MPQPSISGNPVQNVGNRSVGVDITCTYGTAIPTGAWMVVLGMNNVNSDTLAMNDGRAWETVGSRVHAGQSTGPVVKMWRRKAGANESTTFAMSGTNGTVWGISAFVVLDASDTLADWRVAFNDAAATQSPTTETIVARAGDLSIGAFAFQSNPGSATTPTFSNGFVHAVTGSPNGQNLRLNPFRLGGLGGGNISTMLATLATARSYSSVIMSIPEAPPPASGLRLWVKTAAGLRGPCPEYIITA